MHLLSVDFCLRFQAVAGVWSFVIPAQAGIQQRPRIDSRLRGNDRIKLMLSDA
jgi:hypothetical protein